jgi:hypothetical protein
MLNTDKYTIPNRYVYRECVCKNLVIDCIVLTSHLKIVEEKKDKENEMNIYTFFFDRILS